jgi:ankyrin repeat protein
MGDRDHAKQHSLDKALVEACDDGKIRAVVAALDAGANPNAANTWSDLAHLQGTALMRASKHGHIDIARLLCDRGADTNAINGLQNETALHKAAFHGHADVVQLLVERHAQVDLANKFGRTALHIAAGQLRYEVVRYLITAGADINAKDGVGSTPLDCALPYRQASVAKLLKEHGAIATIRGLNPFIPHQT